jgi:hypothetical protein
MPLAQPHSRLALAPALVLALALPAPAVGQGVFDMGVLTNTLSIDAVTLAEEKRSGTGRHAQGAGGAEGPRGSAFTRLVDLDARPAAGAPPVRLAYQPTPALAAKASDAFIGRLRRNNPAVARQVAEAFARVPYDRDFAMLISGSPLTDRDAVDTTSVFILMGWLIANGGMRELPDETGLAVRSQVGSALSRLPELQDASTRAIFGEEMKILSVLLYAGYDGHREGRAARTFSDDVHAMFRDRFGIDMRSLRLTASGLSAR